MKAVIWTDVFQMTSIIVGMLCALIAGVRRIGSFEQVWQIGLENNRVEIEYVNNNVVQALTLYFFQFINKNIYEKNIEVNSSLRLKPLFITLAYLFFFYFCYLDIFCEMIIVWNAMEK